MKSEVRSLKRLDAVKQQVHVTRIQKRLKEDTDEKQKVEREMEERIRFEENIRERTRAL